MKWKHFLAMLCCGLWAAASLAQVRLPRIFANGMVLQRNSPVPVWGWASHGEKISVSFNGQTKSTQADKNGKWMVKLDPMSAGGPYTMTVKGKNTLTITDVLMGEVWVCSGQSNMEWPLRQSARADEEIKAANFPLIRHYKVARLASGNPLDSLASGEWQACSPQTAGNFTAVGYFFARQLHQKLNVPIGLINTTWGGTCVETWISREALHQDADFAEPLALIPADMQASAKQKEEAMMQQIKAQQGDMPPAETQNAQWPQAELDDRQWRTMPLPKTWESSGLPGLDGVVWFRREFTLSEAEAKAGATLSLGPIDDHDITWVNGQQVGATNDHSAARTYALAPQVLKTGRNVVSVRVNDTGGGGGFYGSPDQLFVATASGKQPLAGEWRYRVGAVAKVAFEPSPNAYPTLLYNAMVNPLIPYAMQGVIWYQGESNAGRAYQYRASFPRLIDDWRKRWGRDFPFYFVQLANYKANGGTTEKGSTWAELREAQQQALNLPNTGMAVTIDIGESNDIHPRNKQDVGLRLASNALKITYGIDQPHASPMFLDFKTDGNKAIVSFANTYGQLSAKDKYGYVKGFEIAGADQKFYYAKAYIEGEKIVVTASQVPQPVAVRYGWADDPNDVNVYNAAGFPLAPFRTDQWKGITEGAKFTVSK